MQVPRSYNIKGILEMQTGKVVKVVLHSGSEMEGTLTSVGEALIHLSEINMTFYDAIIRMDAIQALIVRREDA